MLNVEIADILKSPRGAKRFAADGSPRDSSPEQFDADIKPEIAKWAKLARDAALMLYQWE